MAKLRKVNGGGSGQVATKKEIDAYFNSAEGNLTFKLLLGIAVDCLNMQLYRREYTDKDTKVKRTWMALSTADENKLQQWLIKKAEE
jgi:hypothetical protein